MQVEQGKYGATKEVYFELFEVDGIDLRTDWTPAAADCQVSTDGGAYGNSDNIAVVAPTGSGTYKVVLSTTEMTGKVAMIKLVDSATKVFLDKTIKVETYGHASAMHAFDLDTASVAQSADNDTKLTTIATDAARLTAARAGALTDWIDGERLDLLLDAVKAVTDALPDSGALTTIAADAARLTAERAAVLTDWINGERLDLLLDAIPTTAMRGTDDAATEAKQDIIDTNIDQIEAAVITNAAGTDIAADIIAIKAETATIVADTNELQTDWHDGGRLDLLLDGAASAGDPWITALPGAYGVGTAGKIIGDNINAPIGTAQADLDILTGSNGVTLATAQGNYAPAKAGDAMNLAADAIKAVSYDETTAFPVKSVDTGATQIARTGANSDTLETLSDEIAALENLSAAEAEAACDAALVTYDGPTDTEMDAAHALLATPAQVNAQVLDVLNVDTFAEPGQEDPLATTTLVKKIGYLYKFLRNKITNNGSEIIVFADDGVTEDQKSAIGETTGTVTRGEFGTGE